MNPWDDPSLKPIYHVQLETMEFIVSCEVATSDYDAADLATEMLGKLLPNPDATHIHIGCCSSIGYAPVESETFLEFRVTTGNAPFPVDFDGRPVHVVCKPGPSGLYIGTDRLIVSRTFVGDV